MTDYKKTIEIKNKMIAKLREEVRHKDKLIESKDKDYRALKRGEYVVGNGFSESSREPVYNISVTEWTGGTGTGFMTVYAFGRKSAKLTELALKKIFPGCVVETRHKKKSYDEENIYSEL